MDGKVCWRCNEPMGNSNHTDEKGEPIHIKCQKERGEKRESIIGNTSVNKHRLDEKNVWENTSISYLLDNSISNGRGSNLDAIKKDVLHMFNYRSKDLTGNEIEMVKKLEANEEVVNIVLITVFQWFGSCVGIYEMKKLVERICKVKRKGEEVKCKECDGKGSTLIGGYGGGGDMREELCPSCRGSGQLEVKE